MDNKDNRSKDKRHKMKTHFHNKSKYCANSNNASSSSAQMEANMRGIVDIVDSSDEHFLGQSKWCHGKVSSARTGTLGGGRRGSGESEESVCDSRLSTGGSTTSTSYNKKQLQQQQQQKHSGNRKIQSSAHQIYSPNMADMLDELEENEQLNAGDFKVLSQHPTSMGRHFAFASEKQWETAEEEEYLDKSEASEYFTLNLQLLSAGLETIPFYKRMDYSADLFTREQLNAMEQEAELAEKSYQDILSEHIKKSNAKINSAKSHKSLSSVINKNKNNKIDEIDDELEELLQMTTKQLAKVDIQSEPKRNANINNSIDIDVTTTTTTTNVVNEIHNAKDIQDWLDKVLEE